MTGTASTHSSPTSDSTRERLLEAITVDGPISAGDLAERFSLTGAAVRRHLSQLAAEGVIVERDSVTKQRSRGRPRKEFVLATGAATQGEDEAEALTLLALEHLSRMGGDEALADLARARSARWEKAVAERLAEVRARGEEVTPARRAAIVVDYLHDIGYAASLRPVSVTIPVAADDGPVRTLTAVQLCQGRCPVEDIAAQHPVLCEEETGALSRMLQVPVQRLATRAAGAHVCTAHLTPALGDAILAECPGGMTHPKDLSTEGRKP